jgi:hypothetical protein
VDQAFSACDLLVLRGDPPAVAWWLAHLGATDATHAGQVCLAGWRADQHEQRPIAAISGDGKNVAALSGFVANDLQMAQILAARGSTSPASAHVGLAADAVAWLGPQGLGQLRWQGTLAVLHRGLGQIMVARDLFGVGGAYVLTANQTACYGGPAGHRVDLVVTRRRRLPAELAQVAKPLPPGLMLLVGDRGLQTARLRPDPSQSAVLADPDEAAGASDLAAARAWLADHALALRAAAHRGLGASADTPSTVRPPAWWPDPPADVCWLGADSLGNTHSLAAASAAGPDWYCPPGDPPEPTGHGVADPLRAQRLYRCQVLPEQALAQAREANPTPWLVVPALDPPLLATWNAWPAALRDSVVFDEHPA